MNARHIAKRLFHGLLDRPGSGVICEASDDAFLASARVFLAARGFVRHRTAAEGLGPVGTPDRPARARERNLFAAR